MNTNKYFSKIISIGICGSGSSTLRVKNWNTATGHVMYADIFII